MRKISPGPSLLKRGSQKLPPFKKRGTKGDFWIPSFPKRGNMGAGPAVVKNSHFVG